MSINEILLIIAALLPAIILLIYIYKKDRVEKEPLPLLFLLLLAGALIIIPCLIFEIIFGVIIDIGFGVTEENLETFASDPVMFRIYTAVTMFIGIALVEEFFKWLSMRLITERSKHFNSLFDGLVYAIFVSLGFAAIENALYVIQNGWFNAVLRAVLSVPGHMFFAVSMGYFYSLCHMARKARFFENKFIKAGIINTEASRFDSKIKIYKALSLSVPVLIHGLYNYCCSVGSVIETIALFVFVIILYIFCFKHIKALSKDDIGDTTYALKMLNKSYPDIAKLGNTAPDLYHTIISENT